MLIVPIIIFGCASLIMSVIYSIFKDKGDWIGFIVRNITMLLLLVFAIVTINVSNVVNGFSLFIAVALAINMFLEGLQLTSIKDVKVKNILCEVSKGITYLSLMLSAMSLASFSVYALLGGIFVGLAVGMIVWLIKKTDEASEACATIFSFACLGAMLGMAINGIVFTGHMLSAILVLVGGGLLLASDLLNQFLKEGRVKNILVSEFKIIALVLLVVAIYLFN